MSRLKDLPRTVVRVSKPVFSVSLTLPCLLVGMPVPRCVMIIFLATPLLDLGLRPRRHSEQQHFFQRPDVIGQAGRHRWRPRPPPLGRARAVGRHRLR
jgi:hypothetical protein